MNMNAIEWLGWLASQLVLATFCRRGRVPVHALPLLMNARRLAEIVLQHHGEVTVV